MSEPSTRVPVPLLLSRERTMWLSAAATVIALVGGTVYFATQEATRVPAIIGGVLLLAGVALLVRRTWLDTERGVVVREIARVLRRRVAWAEASTVRIRSNHAGQALLQVDRIYLPLVAVDIGGDRSQPAEFLRTLADQVEHWAPTRASVVTQLRAQADHVEAGGSVRESPIARAYLARPVRR